MASLEIETIKTLSQFANLKAYYRFSSGALTTDSSGAGHTLTAISDQAEDASGKFGGAVALDGNDAYSATDHADFKPTGNYTFSCWFKGNTNPAANAGLFQSYSNNTKIAGISIRLDAAGKLIFLTGNNTGTTLHTNFEYTTSSVAVTDNVWHLLTCVYNGATLGAYIDGTLDVSTAWTNAAAYAATNYVRLMTLNNAGTDEGFITGSLDDVVFFDRALTADEISKLYNGTWPSSNFFAFF